jgi:hypothetical protein
MRLVPPSPSTLEMMDSFSRYYSFCSNVHREPGWQRLWFSWVGTMKMESGSSDPPSKLHALFSMPHSQSIIC